MYKEDQMTLMNDIRTYTRDTKGAPTGILIATKSTREGHKYHIGWASCNTKLDKFAKPLALHIAVGRLKAAEDIGAAYIPKGMPHKVRKLLDRFVDRCDRYFK
jgi:hypothetical protein